MNIPKQSFYFIRHGETDWNKQNLRQGQIDIPLNETGIIQAAALKDLVADLDIYSVCYSPLQRTTQTMQLATAHLTCTKLPIDELKEWHFGDWEGQPKDISISNEAIHTVLPPNGEAFHIFANRVLRGMQKALLLPGPVLIIGHGGVYAAVCHHLHIPIHGIGNGQLIHFTHDDHRQLWIAQEIVR